jgi:hypothetical protein
MIINRTKVPNVILQSGEHSSKQILLNFPLLIGINFPTKFRDINLKIKLAEMECENSKHNVFLPNIQAPN